MTTNPYQAYANSRALWERASRVMPGGVNASARYNAALGHALYFERGEGAYLYDRDGRRYIDLLTSHGASLLGHGHPAVVKAAEAALTRGILAAYETELQVRTAEKTLALFPGAEMMRYTCSGTETTWHALRIARAFTGKIGVVKFEGHYHGVNDTVGFSHWPKVAEAGAAESPVPVADSAGIPPYAADYLTVLPFNDAAALERTLREKADTLAALIMEPVNYDSCGICAQPEFLRLVRELTRELGIVLIFDEILSGFRVGPGGAMASTGIYPDMTCLGKAYGGGLPLSAILGTREIMMMCTPVGPALQSGTYNAPPLLVAGAEAFLDTIAAPDFYPHLNELAERLYGGMREVFARRGIRAWVQGVGARFGLLFGLEREPLNYRDIAAQDWEMARRFHLACLKRGVYIMFKSPHHGFSSAHTLADIDLTLDVMDDAAAEIAQKR
ncbi:MAG: aspartate aminotransferase family protein [Chloroflexi bacterium]|nr:aspartate aminotransferase family protein [Chloroflexota bacterium]